MDQILIAIVIIIVGYFYGTRAEKRHYKSIIEREAKVRLPVHPTKTSMNPAGKGTLVQGSVVVAQDGFKQVLASLRNLIGGRVSSYESLVDRARREAILRMTEQAIQIQADEVVNLRVETSTIGVGSVEVFAYGTALKYEIQSS